MDESADEDGAEAGAGHEEDLHHLPPPLEVLPQHQGGRVPRHRHPDTCATVYIRHYNAQISKWNDYEILSKDPKSLQGKIKASGCSLWSQ